MGAPPLPARLSSPSGRCMRIGCTHKVIIHRPRLCSRLNVHAAAHSASQQAWETSGDLPDLPANFLRGAAGCSWGPLFAAGVGTGDQNPMGDDWKGGEILRLLAPVALAALPLAAGRCPSSPRAPVVHCRGPLPRHRLTARRTQTPDEQVSRCAVLVRPRTESASRIYINYEVPAQARGK